MDEKIAKLVSEAEMSLENHFITEGPVKVGSALYEFAPRYLYEHRFQIYLPDEFTEMPERLRRIKYPYENRPELILSDEAGAIDFTFKRLEQELEDEMVRELTEGMRSMLQRANPTHVFYESGIEQVEDKPIGFMEFKSTVMDGALYTLMYFLAFEGRAMMGTFCCNYKMYSDWRDIAYQVMRTIHILDEEEKA